MDIGPHWSRRPALVAGFAAGALLLPAMLGGCVANSSNPVVRLGDAAMSAHDARIGLEIENPGGRNLVVRELEYQLAHGETGLPVADGRWSGALDLPAGKSARLELVVPFTVEPLEPDSRKFALGGTMRLEDRTGFLGLRFMDMTSTPFQLDGEAREPAKPETTP